MKKRFKPIIQKALEIILAFNFVIICSVDDFELSFVPVLFVFIILTGHIAIQLLEHGVFENEGNL